MKKFAALIVGLALVGCSVAQQSDIHAALLEADKAIALAEQNPAAVQAAFDALDKLDGHNAKLATAIARAKDSLSTQNLDEAHQAIKVGLAVSAPKDAPK